MARPGRDRFCVGDSTVGPLNGPLSRASAGCLHACVRRLPICRVQKSIKEAVRQQFDAKRHRHATKSPYDSTMPIGAGRGHQGRN